MKKMTLIVGLLLILGTLSLSGCVENQKSETEKKYPSAVFLFSIDANIDDGVLNAANIVLPTLTSDTVNFISDGSTDPDGNIVDYYWDFGDDETGTGESVEHKYNDEGTYNVSLLVVDNDGLSNKIYKTIKIESIPSINLSHSVINFNDTESYKNGSLNISVIGTQNPPVGIWEINSCIDEYWEDDAYEGWSCIGFAKEIVNLDRFIESSSYQMYIDGTYFDVDNDKYVSVGDYIHYSYSFGKIGTPIVVKIKYSLKLGSHNPSPMIGNFTYDFS